MKQNNKVDDMNNDDPVVMGKVAKELNRINNTDVFGEDTSSQQEEDMIKKSETYPMEDE